MFHNVMVGKQEVIMEEGPKKGRIESQNQLPIAKLHEHLINIYEIEQPIHSECCIYRVHEGLRRVKPEAYEPMVVSIGPYHRQNPRLQAMERHKRWYLASLLQRINEPMESYVLELKTLEDRVRRCYAEPIDLDSEKFVEMMLLDGCFIIEFFRNQTPNPALSAEWMKNQIIWDMILLENQLPFFLLSHLYDMTSEDLAEEPFMGRVVYLFRLMVIPAPCFNPEFSYRHKRIFHLLDLVHVLCNPSDGPRISNRNTRVETEKEVYTINQMHGAVELAWAGIKFKKIGEFYTGSANWFNIEFKNGLMKVPCFVIDDRTDTFFRNLIAFEQLLDVDGKYFTDFVDFMDQLISSEKDVELLRLKGIIVSYLGDDQDVSNLFNKLGVGVIASSSFCPFSEVRRKVNMHCRKTRYRILASVRRYYFKNPLPATLVAIFVLILLQTINSFKN